jgi:dolichyl-phosphate-mannose-protein mannosyltransferase
LTYDIDKDGLRALGSKSESAHAIAIEQGLMESRPGDAATHETSVQPRVRRRLALTCLVLGVIALALFLAGIGNPARIYYDEGLYVPVAKAFLNDAPDPSPYGPPLGKFLVAIGIKLVGDNPLGWRIASAVCGSLTLVAVFLWTYLLSKDYGIACIAGVLTLVNNFLFVMSRVAMMDVFLVFFLFWGLVAYTAALELDLGTAKRRILLCCSGISIGLAGACKWNAVDTLLVLLLTSFALFWISKRPFGNLSPSIARYAENVRQVGISNVVLALVVSPAVSYTLTFWPQCRSLQLPFGIHQFLAMNLYIWRFHLAVVGNPFIISAWYSWPLNLSPQRALSYLVGNPVVMWGGLVALVFCFRRFWKSFAFAEGLIVLLYAANLLQWAVTPAKCTFYYYYFPAAMVLGVAIALMLHSLPQTIFGVRISLLVLSAAAVVFLWCLPRMAHLDAPWDCALGCWS